MMMVMLWPWDCGGTVQRLPLSTAITILEQCAAGMHHLHSLGIIHRDFRAANILVAGTVPLHVVVADFGVSHRLRVYAQVLCVDIGLVPQDAVRDLWQHESHGRSP